MVYSCVHPAPANQRRTEIPEAEEGVKKVRENPESGNQEKETGLRQILPG